MIINSEQDLIGRINSAQEILLVRAINDYELDQLLANARVFQFNRGTEYELAEYGERVRMYSERRNGTVIVYPLQKGDIGGIFDENRRFDIKRWAYCVKSFTAPVEVYNVKSLNLEQLRELRRKETSFDQVVREVIMDAYTKLNTPKHGH